MKSRMQLKAPILKKGGLANWAGLGRGTPRASQRRGVGPATEHTPRSLLGGIQGPVTLIRSP
jgi:hypothetical protein